MIANWAYAALAEHIYRRDQGADQAIRDQELAGQGGLASLSGLFAEITSGNRGAELTARGFFISEGRYIYNPATGFEATIAQGAGGELIIVFRGTDFLDLVIARAEETHAHRRRRDGNAPLGAKG